MQYLRFFLNNKRLISFGFLLTFFSSYGQTFLISFYVPGIMKDFQIANSSFGMIYGLATIVSSLTLAYVGQFIDRRNLKNYTLTAVFLLMAACLLIAFSSNLIVLFVGFWGLRLAGQGLFIHISYTAVSRFFNETRGRALSLSVLGHPIGEGFFPLFIGALIGLIGWRNSMLLNAAIVCLVLLPFVTMALHKNESFCVAKDISGPQGRVGFSRSRLFRDKNFYIVALNLCVLPFMVTGLFFYQLALAQEKGWSVEWLSASFMGYAIGRAVFSLWSGKLIDRYSSVHLFPFYLLPFAVGLSALTFFDGPFVAPFYLSLTGISMGLGSTIETAAMAEIYGTDVLGSVRSVFATLMVLSTAASPALFGFLLDSGFDFMTIAGLSVGLVLMAITVSCRLHPKFSVQFQPE